VIKSPHNEPSVKLDFGALVVYTSTFLHRVERVTQGVRLAAVTWVQNLIRDAHQREICLIWIRRGKAFLKTNHGKSPEFDSICKFFTNLLRLWAEV